MKILVFGANGQLGRALLRLSREEGFPIGWSVEGVTRNELDFCNREEVKNFLHKKTPNVIFNAAAYTKVDLAESEQAECLNVNVTFPKILAEYCVEQGARLVHYSSDYVYSGKGNEPHLETEAPNPLNFYGRSKALGDVAIQETNCKHLIFRTSWVYSHEGKNFFLTLLSKSQEQKHFKIVSDQWGAPTYAPDLASDSMNALMKAVEDELEKGHFESGVYHLTNSGVINWSGFARAFLGSDVVIQEIRTSEYPTPAVRPLNSRLSLEKFKKRFAWMPRLWDAALQSAQHELERIRSK